MSLANKYGIFRSWLIYYAKPFNRSRLKKFYSQFVKSGDLVFDIGAHLGNRSQAFLDLDAKVIAVEPQESCITFLNNKFGKNPSFQLIKGLVSDHSGEVPFFINKTSPTISTARNKSWQNEINKLSFTKPSFDQEIKVESYSLDQLIFQYGLPAYCKIDTEGFELEVLQGLSHPVPYISIEYLEFDKSRILDCIARIQTLGEYRINFSPGESQKWNWSDWKSSDEIIAVLKQDALIHKFGDLFFKLI